jgi:hemolysin activation/secretion protein
LGNTVEKKTTLPTGETPCFLIREITLQGADANAFRWVLEKLAGPKNDDNPRNQCLGANGINTVLQRGQAAAMERGFVTTRVLAQPQDLSSGTLALTVLAGRIEAIRFEADVSLPAPTSLFTAVPTQPGALLNLRDIEQALENHTCRCP